MTAEFRSHVSKSFLQKKIEKWHLGKRPITILNSCWRIIETYWAVGSLAWTDRCFKPELRVKLSRKCETKEAPNRQTVVTAPPLTRESKCAILVASQISSMCSDGRTPCIVQGEIQMRWCYQCSGNHIEVLLWMYTLTPTMIMWSMLSEKHWTDNGLHSSARTNNLPKNVVEIWRFT